MCETERDSEQTDKIWESEKVAGRVNVCGNRTGGCVILGHSEGTGVCETGMDGSKEISDGNRQGRFEQVV